MSDTGRTHSPERCPLCATPMTPHGCVECSATAWVETGRVLTPRTVNDYDSQGERCWICNVPGDHDGAPHAEATGDGLTRYDIIDYLTAPARTPS